MSPRTATDPRARERTPLHPHGGAHLRCKLSVLHAISNDAAASQGPVVLGHVLVLGATLLLLVNDHVFKHWRVLPSCVVGKLSDFAGLFVCPLLLAAGANAVLVWTLRRELRSCEA